MPKDTLFHPSLDIKACASAASSSYQHEYTLFFHTDNNIYVAHFFYYKAFVTLNSDTQMWATLRNPSESKFFSKLGT